MYCTMEDSSSPPTGQRKQPQPHRQQSKKGGRTATTQKRAAKVQMQTGVTTRSRSKKARVDSTPQSKTTIAITPLSVLQYAKKDATPASSANNSTSARSSSEVDDETSRALSRALLLTTAGLPITLPDIFDFPKQQPSACQCHHFTSSVCCLGRCDTVQHLDSYGWEYKALLKEREDREFRRPTATDADEDEDPYKLLTLSEIVPPLDKRTRQQTEWASSIQWELERYMDRQPDLTPPMRSILVDWMVELSEEYKLSPITLHLAVTLVDKSLACTPLLEEGKVQPDGGMTIPRDMLQCLGWYVSTLLLCSVVPPFVFLPS
jgi:hypothetical protein